MSSNNKQDIMFKVKHLLSEQLEKDINLIKETSLLREDLGIDSFGAVELIYALEEKLNIKLLQEEFVGIKDVQGIVDCIYSKQI